MAVQIHPQSAIIAIFKMIDQITCTNTNYLFGRSLVVFHVYAVYQKQLHFIECQ